MHSSKTSSTCPSFVSINEVEHYSSKTVSTYPPFTSRNEVERYISKHPVAYALYKGFRPEWKTLVQDFFLSKRTLPLTYDPFFRRRHHEQSE